MSIVSQTDFEDTPEGWHDFWLAELDTAKENAEDRLKRGGKALECYLDKRRESEGTRLNLFHSNVNNMRSFLFGNAPKSQVMRRNADANDDVARVASEMLSRMINNDIEESGNDFTSVLQCALDDRLIPGLGVARVRYVLDTGTREIDPYENDEGEQVTTEEYMKSEEASVDYVHWRDLLWGYTRTWKDLPWMAFRSYLTKDQATKRFGKEVAEALEYKEIGPNSEKEEPDDEQKDSWQRAEIWEICSKNHQKYFWFSYGYDKILDTKGDFLKFKGFWPTPQWMIANATTTNLDPVPDYYFAQDLYNEIDDLQERICILTDAVKVVGAYDQTFKTLARILSDGVDNELFPVENWARFAEKGGFEGVMAFVPIEDTVNAITQLRELLSDRINLLYQVTGMSDIMQGQSSQKGRVSAAEQKIKAKFGSIRIQALQDQFARFASDLAAMKAEVICKHFSPQTIIEQSGIMHTMDAQYADAAVQFLKSPWEKSAWRIEIKPETVAMTDYQQLQQERVEYLNGLATFMQSSVPLVQLHPQTGPVLLELLKWGLAGFKGSNQIEGVLDRAIQVLTSQPPPQKPDPDKAKIEQEKIKGANEEKRNAQEHQQAMMQGAQKHSMEMKELAMKAKTTEVQEAEKRKSSAVTGLIKMATLEKQSEVDSKKKPTV